ncbi:MAG: hypothetical protein M3Q09_07740, partial [Gemmatimonadota bacterium]|nr:hypothetical protein [Gemmatimonadota bacterium]
SEPGPGIASPQITAAPVADDSVLTGARSFAAQTAAKSPVSNPSILSESTGAMSVRTGARTAVYDLRPGPQLQ